MGKQTNDSTKYHAYRGESGKYDDIAGFCKEASVDDIRDNDYILTPGRYVGFEEIQEDEEVFEEKMKSLNEELAKSFAESHELEIEIKKNLKRIGFDI